MWIKMLQTRRGSEDGFKTAVYEKDKSYNIPDLLARYFMRQGWACNDEPINDDLYAEYSAYLDNLSNPAISFDAWEMSRPKTKCRKES